MKDVLLKVFAGIFNYFFSLFHLIGDCFKFKWTPEAKRENILGLLRAAFVAVPIIVAVVTCFTYYSNHPFVPNPGEMFGFSAISTYYTFNSIFVAILLGASIVFLILAKRGPEFALLIKLILFNFVFMPAIIFCVTNLYLLIALIIIIALVVVFGRMLFNEAPKREDRNKRPSFKETDASMPPKLGDFAYTKNKKGTKFRVKNRHRVKVYVNSEGQMTVATNSFGEASVDLGAEKDFRNGSLALFDENNNEISTRDIRHIK